MSKVSEYENNLLSDLERHDQLIADCAGECISFSDFLGQYDNFYVRWPLYGDEFGLEALELFKKYEDRIAPHRDVWESILTRVFSDDEPQKEWRLQEGKFGSDEGLKRLKQISVKMGGKTV